MRVYVRVRNIKWNFTESQDSSLYPTQCSINIPNDVVKAYTKDEIIKKIKAMLISTFDAQFISAEYYFVYKEDIK